jgi:hypothetical protein
MRIGETIRYRESKGFATTIKQRERTRRELFAQSSGNALVSFGSMLLKPSVKPALDLGERTPRPYANHGERSASPFSRQTRWRRELPPSIGFFFWADFTRKTAIDNEQINDRQHQRRDEPGESELERMQRGGRVVDGKAEAGIEGGG